MTQKTDSPRMEVSVTPKLVTDEVSSRPPTIVRPRDASTAARVVPERERPRVAPAVGVVRTATTEVEALVPPSSTLALPPTTTPLPTSTVAPCDINVAIEDSLRIPAGTALAVLNEATSHVRFHVADTGSISINHGGEWPVVQPPLGWTAPDRRTILINPDHPASTIDSAVADVIAHEMGHVLISTSHVSDGTILDPQIDGHITLGKADREFLDNLTCTQLGL